jgi:hypothetical protein
VIDQLPVAFRLSLKPAARVFVLLPRHLGLNLSDADFHNPNFQSTPHPTSTIFQVSCWDPSNSRHWILKGLLQEEVAAAEVMAFDFSIAMRRALLLREVGEALEHGRHMIWTPSPWFLLYSLKNTVFVLMVAQGTSVFPIPSFYYYTLPVCIQFRRHKTAHLLISSIWIAAKSMVELAKGLYHTIPDGSPWAFPPRSQLNVDQGWRYFCGPAPGDFSGAMGMQENFPSNAVNGASLAQRFHHSALRLRSNSDDMNAVKI